MQNTANSWMDYSIIVVYMLTVIGIGFIFNSKKETTENYLLGGRNMPFLAIGLSCIMSLLSSIAIVQVPGEIFNHGWTLFALGLFVSIPLQIPCYLLFTRFYFKLGSYTPYEYLEYRYNASVRGLIAISGFYSSALYIGMVLYTTAKIFEGAYGWPAWFTILLVGLVGGLYTVLGGMKAVVWTDVIQFFVLAGGMAALLVTLNNQIDGGLPAAVVYAFENGRGVPQWRDAEFFSINPYARLLFFLLLWNAIFSPLVVACSNQINIQRLLSTKDWKAGFKSQIVATVLAGCCTLALALTGFAIFTYYNTNPDPYVLEKGGDVALFRFVTNKLPSPLPAIFMAAMLAAIMSTLDSAINSMATVWLKEIHQKFINRHLTPEGEVRIAKYATIIVVVFAILFGLAIDASGQWLKQSVTEVGTLFVIFGAATLPAFLIAVLSKRANSVLIWCFTLFSFGDMITKNLWYALSRTAEQAWQANPSLSFGWAGKISPGWWIVCIVTGALLCAPWFYKSLRHKLCAKIPAFTSMFFFGAGTVFFEWWFFSHRYITDRPLACSFAFFLPVSYVLLPIALFFCPVQPRKKWQGLILQSINDPILK